MRINCPKCKKKADFNFNEPGPKPGKSRVHYICHECGHEWNRLEKNQISSNDIREKLEFFRSATVRRVLQTLADSLDRLDARSLVELDDELTAQEK